MIIIRRGPTADEVRQGVESALKSHSHWVHEPIEITEKGESYFITKGPPKQRIKPGSVAPVSVFSNPDEIPMQSSCEIETYQEEVKIPYLWQRTDVYDRETGEHIGGVYFRAVPSQFDGWGPPTPIKADPSKNLTTKELSRYRRS